MVIKLSECEEMLMKIIWSSPADPDLQTITEQMKSVFKKEWKPQTTATILKRIEQKKYISVYKTDRHSHYRPIVDFEIYQQMKLKELLQLCFDGNKEALRAAIEKLQ